MKIGTGAQRVKGGAIFRRCTFFWGVIFVLSFVFFVTMELVILGLCDSHDGRFDFRFSEERKTGMTGEGW